MTLSWTWPKMKICITARTTYLLPLTTGSASLRAPDHWGKIMFCWEEIIWLVLPRCISKITETPQSGLHAGLKGSYEGEVTERSSNSFCKKPWQRNIPSLGPSSQWLEFLEIKGRSEIWDLLSLEICWQVWWLPIYYTSMWIAQIFSTREHTID